MKVKPISCLTLIRNFLSSGVDKTPGYGTLYLHPFTKQEEETMSETIQNLTRTEQSIYGEYRSVLRSIKQQPGNRNSRAADRKQQALKIVADRKHIRISEVKNIVRAGDAAKGITHEHTENYLEELRVENLLKEIQAEILINPADCSVCLDWDEEPTTPVTVRLNGNLYEATGETEFNYRCEKHVGMNIDW
jgi:hypothetical protein